MLACLSGQQSFSLCTVAFRWIVLLESILNFDSFVHEELTIHALNRLICSFKGIIEDKTETFGIARLVTLNLDRLDEVPKVDEGIVKRGLVNVDVQVTDEKVRSDIDLLLIR